jgi:hypothetical protein
VDVTDSCVRRAGQVRGEDAVQNPAYRDAFNGGASHEIGKVEIWLGGPSRLRFHDNLGSGTARSLLGRHCARPASMSSRGRLSGTGYAAYSGLVRTRSSIPNSSLTTCATPSTGRLAHCPEQTQGRPRACRAPFRSCTSLLAGRDLRPWLSRRPGGELRRDSVREARTPTRFRRGHQTGAFRGRRYVKRCTSPSPGRAVRGTATRVEGPGQCPGAGPDVRPGPGQRACAR